MKKKTLILSFIVACCISLTILQSDTFAQAPHPKFFNERFVIKTMANIHAAEMTYYATAGSGSFGSLTALHNSGLIDSALASGLKYGYSFVLQFSPNAPGTPPTFSVTATPVAYRKTGQRSFFIDASGLLRGGDKSGGLAGVGDPYIDSCALWGLADNERCTILDMRALHGAQITYAATIGNGNYGTSQELYQAGLIRADLATGFSRGYLYQYFVIYQSPPNVPASFRLTSNPRTYGTTGVRSFYIDQTGVLRGADRGGQPATEADPVIDDCTNGTIGYNERCTISSLRTLHGAEMTYSSTYGNGNFGSLSQLNSAGFIRGGLASGLTHGYSFTVTFVIQTSTVPASFRITAVPQTYGTTGIRSFFIGTEGVIYCADKNGAPADENDPPCNQ